MSSFRPHPSSAVAVAILIAAFLALPGCRGSSFGAGGVGAAGGAEEGAEPRLAGGEPGLGNPASSRGSDPGTGLTLGSARDAEVDLGTDGYAEDPRVRTLVDRWPQAVGDALDRLAFVAGLTFASEIDPRVVLRPLGNEAEPWRLEVEVAEGRRRPVVSVNIEPIAAEVVDADEALAGALAAAVFQDLSLRRLDPPAWLVRAATIVAAARLEEGLHGLARRLRRTGKALVVDPREETAVEATALAAILVLVDSDDPQALSSFFGFAAEGDDPDAILAGILRDPLGRWAGGGRDLLAARLEGIDVSAWQAVATARAALAEAGRAALEASVEPDLPADVAAEIEVLRARAFLDEGRYESAREIFAAFDAPALGRLDDPAAAWLLHLHAERGPGGDATRGEALARRIRLDFPRAWRRWGGATERGEAGGATGDLEREADRVASLLADHRGGEAHRALTLLGERARAPELEAVSRAVAEAEHHPPPDAIVANRPRVGRWLAAPSRDTAAEVRAGGAAAAEVLARRLPHSGGTPSRADALRLLLQTTRTGHAVGLLAPLWSRQPSWLASDLDALLGTALYAELRVWIDGTAKAAVAQAGGDALWEAARFGLREDWVRSNGGVVLDLRHAEYTRRREAFHAVVDAGEATPTLVARALKDPAPLLRREAVTTAAEKGFTSLVRYAIADEAWIVRQATCFAIGAVLEDEAARLLLTVLHQDPAAQVRLAAARTLLILAEDEPALLDPLVRTLAAEDPLVRDELTARLPSLAADPLVRAVFRALEAEAATPKPRVPYLSRLFLVLQRATQRDPGYYHTMTAVELRQLLDHLRRALASKLGAQPRTTARSGPRR